MRNALSKKPFSKNCGVTLVELMISITLGLVIMSGVIQLYVSGKSNSRIAQSSIRIQDNMRYALHVLGNDIAQAGNIKCTTTDVVNNLPNVLNVGDWNDFINTYVSGRDVVFDPAQPVASSDTLIVKRVDHSRPQDIVAVNANSFQVNNANNLQNGEIAVAGDCGRMVVLELAVAGVGIALPNLTANALLDMGASPILYTGATGAYTYSINDSAGGACTGASIHQCSLYREKNNSGAQELVQGVHGLDVQYGVELAPDNVTYYDAYDGDGNFQRINRVKVTLWFNSAEEDGNVVSKNVTRVFAIRSSW